MRPVLACLITVFLIGGTFAYIQFAESVRRPAVEIHIDYDEAVYSVDVERSFECVADPVFSPAALKLTFKQETVYEHKATLPPETPLTISNLPGVEVGENEIYVSANRDEFATGFDAIRVTINRNGTPIMVQTIASEPFLSVVGGPIVFTVQPAQEKNDDHAH
ncbi:MAG: hypothetical protein ACI87E_000842 [Mariniblastus sp.]|jgi:hypothetical protein